MKKINVVKRNDEFNLVMNKGRYIKNNNLNRYRFGISVGKKICNAVNRNKLKRQVRNILDYHKNLYSKSKDYIIIVRKSSLNEEYSVLEKNLVELLEKTENKHE